MGLRPQERHEAILAPGLPYHIAARDVRATSERYLMMLRSALLTLACTAGLAGVAHAQQTQPQNADSVPKAYRPPPGMCRIWLDKVPAKQQPAPTDCRTAVHDKPTNGKVIFGDDYVESGKKGEDKELPFVKKFGEDKRKP